jgi:hypothetical protein
MECPFPLVLRADLEGREYHGFVSVNDVDYRIRVCRTVPHNFLELEVEPDLKILLRKEEETIRQRLERSDTIPGFLAELKEILDRLSIVNERCSISSAPPAEAMQRIIEEIEEVGWENVVSLHDGFRTVGIAVADEVNNAVSLMPFIFQSGLPIANSTTSSRPPPSRRRAGGTCSRSSSRAVTPPHRRAAAPRCPPPTSPSHRGGAVADPVEEGRSAP